MESNVDLMDDVLAALKELKEQEFFRSFSDAELDFIEKCVRACGLEVLEQMRKEEDE